MVIACMSRTRMTHEAQVIPLTCSLMGEGLVKVAVFKMRSTSCFRRRYGHHQASNVGKVKRPFVKNNAGSMANRLPPLTFLPWQGQR